MDFKEKIISILTNNELTLEQQQQLETIFPELKESEDERIRKKLISLVENWTIFNPNSPFDDYPIYTSDKSTVDKILAWLERQGEQEIDKWGIGDIIRHGGILALVIEGRRAMKPNGEIFTIQYPDEWVKASRGEIEYFFNKLVCEKQGVIAWNEEDEERFNRTLFYVRHPRQDVLRDTMLVEWLKSLRDRLQH